MTLEQIAADIVGKQCDTDACTDRREDRCDCTQAIATALRKARNEALEEAATAADDDKYNEVDDDWDDGYRTACRVLSRNIRALKHKDGQP